MSTSTAVQPLQPRVTPASHPIEACVLGSILFEPGMLPDLPPIVPRDFFWDAHSNIWRIILDLHKANRAPYEATVRDEIEARGWQDRTAGRNEAGDLVGNCAYLECLVAVAAPHMLAHAATKLLELSRARRGIRCAQQLIGALQTGSIATDESLARGVDELTEISHSAAPAEEAATLAQLALDEANRVIACSTTAATQKRASTGQLWLDNAMLGGFQPDTFTVIGARPGSGKSKLGCFMLASASLSGVKTALISLDMGRKLLMPYIVPAFHNTICDDWITSRQVASPMADGEMGEARLRQALARIAPERCRIVSDPSSFSLAAISAQIRRLVNDGCEVVMIDQLQDIHEWSLGTKDRSYYYEIFHELRINLVRRYHFALVGLHQLRREGLECPKLEDFKDSGGVEEMIDYAILVHDYQGVYSALHMGFVLEDEGRKIRAPKPREMGNVLTEPLPQRIISLYLAKTRSSGKMRRDVKFDYAHGVALKS